MPITWRGDHALSKFNFVELAKLKLKYIKIIENIFMVPEISKFKVDFYQNYKKSRENPFGSTRLRCHKERRNSFVH